MNHESPLDKPIGASRRNPDWLDVVREKVEQLKFGSIQIIVHEGRVTQVESIEKTRFSSAPSTRTSQS
jgi:hypothetical protein